MSIDDVLKEKDVKKRNKLYNDYVTSVTPKHKCWVNVLWAFVTGGLVCTLGQGLNDIFMSLGFDEKKAGLYGMLILILLSVILTGLGLFAKITKKAGAGVLVPITGFANSVASPAIEFKKEGQVFGIGCKIFTIAGPVILYGVFCSWVLGFIYWFGKMLGIV